MKENVGAIPDLTLSDFDYSLPPSCIATEPAEPRDSSKLMVLHRHTGKVEHRTFRDLAEYLKPEDCLVLNQTEVLPSRLMGHKQTGGKIDILMVRPFDQPLAPSTAPSRSSGTMGASE
ncbi:MAG: S-adenosylmethionine:tRNA ribosyltransferase-isomerase, partial [Elusimicrobia bacterium]|nr:S-adenosylmethionine:tRNA ribosyltransferase-isomerase [Elusimicrobiota bacterium]